MNQNIGDLINENDMLKSELQETRTKCLILRRECTDYKHKASEAVNNFNTIEF